MADLDMERGQKFVEIFPKGVKDGLKAVEIIIGEIEKIISE